MNAPAINLHIPVRNAIKTLIQVFVETTRSRQANADLAGTDELIAQLDQLLLSNEAFLQKVHKLDQLVSQYPAFTSLKEYLFDFLLTNFLAAEVHLLGEEYLDSAEWQKVEEETLDRGTELFNLLLYINEAIDEDVEISLDDFLKEFLLTEEDEFQDEHNLYEDLISNQELLEAEAAEVIKVWKMDIKDQSGIEDLFIPMYVFFADPEALQAERDTIAQLQGDKDIPAEQTALLQSVYAFKNGFHDQINFHAN